GRGPWSPTAPPSATCAVCAPSCAPRGVIRSRRCTARATSSAPAERMRRRPRLRTILFAVNLVILALPLGGVTVLRLYESALVRQTESELLGQAAILAAAYRAALALRGEPVSLLRERVSEAPRPPLASLSRGTRVRVFVALPVLDGRRVVGAVVLSRSPRSIGETLYDKRLHLLAGAGVLLAVVVLMTLFTSRTISRPLEAVVGQSQRAA